MKSFKLRFLPIILTLSTVTFLTILSLLYAKGYRLLVNVSNTGHDIYPTPRIVLRKTGILAVRSIPDSAKVYMNDNLVDITNATLSSLSPGKYNLKVIKEGFEIWQKEVVVFEDLVTDITALLVLKGGGLNPLTNTGVSDFALSKNGEMLAYLTKGEEKPGLWVLQLSDSPLNIFQTNKRVLALDSDKFSYSSGEALFWSPDDQEILVKMNDRGYLLLDTAKPPTQIPIILSRTQDIFNKWENLDLENKLSNAEGLMIPNNIKISAVSANSVWSPDGEKFYLVEKDSEYNIIMVYNFEDPLPIGESRINLTAKFKVDQTPNIFWYSDSKHLIFVTGRTISLVNIDGTNLVELFSGDVIGSKAYSSPSGDKVIILSKFKSDAPENLYTISIR